MTTHCFENKAQILQTMTLKRGTDRHCMVDITMIEEKSLISTFKYQLIKPNSGTDLSFS